MLDVIQTQQQQITGTGNAEMDRCLGMHLDRAEQALQVIYDVQSSPFEYTLAKMLCRMESIETIALESMLGMVQDMLDQCKPNPQNVLLQLGLHFHLQGCWLSACQCQQTTDGLFLLAPLSRVRDQLKPHCEPIVRSRYPKLVEKIMDSLLVLLCDGEPQPMHRSTLPNPSPTKGAQAQSEKCNGTAAAGTAAGTAAENAQPVVSVFQFVALFRGKQFPALIENLSHEAWITTTLETGQPSAVRDVMERLRNVPVVPPMESLRYIGLVLSQQPPHVCAPIEKYFRKASPELVQDLAACFLCLLEHNDELSRCGACRALAMLRQGSTRRCLEFLSRSDTSPRVRAEAQSAALQIHRYLRACQQQETTKI